MLKVLLVDDEPGALKAMKYLLEWEPLGFTIAGEATDGEEALEALRRQAFDLMITDIRMPEMSGLDLIRRVREFSRIPVIVMSGYEEFDYIRQCMSYGVKDYLLKPVSRDDVNRLLGAVKQEIAHEHLLAKQLYLGIPAMRDQMLKKWVHGFLRNREEDEQFALLHIEVADSQTFRCLIAEMDFMEESDSIWTDEEIQIKRFAVRNVMEEVISGFGYMFEEADDRYGVVLHGTESAWNEPATMALCAKIVECVDRFAKVPVTIGVGETVHAQKDVVKSFHTADHMAERKFLLGSRSIITPERFAAEDGKQSLLQVQEVQTIVEAVRSLERDEVGTLLETQRRRFADCDAPKQVVQTAVFELLVNLFRMAREQGGPLQGIFDAELDDYSAIMEARTIDKLYEFALCKCEQTMRSLISVQPMQPMTAVEQVKRIVSEQYGGNLSLRSIGDQIFMNAAYLGRLFKAEEEVSFNDYLLMVRMERAKELLRTTDKKAYEIALEVGYREHDWFYKKFKDYAGMSTSDYRTKWRTFES
ncbi:response regulator [Paenibacillus sp. MBLB4367]|uniref:response regulator n=1 Tax=Paenibacillus sp. MBLB4367 TaxID=3384767 RepID=UPI0039082857